MSKKPKIVCVTGGKGGTGKTLVAVNLAVMFKNEGLNTLLIDGDVENPNTYLLLGGELKNPREVKFFKPEINEEKCTKCGLCAENCATHALLHINGAYPIPMLTVCSGCKLCFKICPTQAIEDEYKIIGKTFSAKFRGLSNIVGELKTGEARSAAVVEALLDELDEIIEENEDQYDMIVLDTAPGAHCDVELLINKADYVIPVTEPTKFGKLDLIRIIELIELLGKPHKAIINRSSLLGFKEEFLKELKDQGIDVLGDIPLDQDIVNSYCQGVPIVDKDSGFDPSGPGVAAFNQIFANLKEWIKKEEEGN